MKTKQLDHFELCRLLRTILEAGDPRDVPDVRFVAQMCADSTDDVQRKKLFTRYASITGRVKFSGTGYSEAAALHAMEAPLLDLQPLADLLGDE